MCITMRITNAYTYVYSHVYNRVYNQVLSLFSIDNSLAESTYARILSRTQQLPLVARRHVS